jgi:hypothetical protein
MPVVAIQWTRERIMNRPTDVQRLRKFLEAWPGQKISMAKLKVELDSRRNWPGEKVERVVEKAIADPKMCISHGKSGNVEFTGSERASDPLLYRQVARILSTSWAVEQKLKDTTPYFTAHGGHRGAMDWLHPDVVVTGRGKKRFPSDDGRRWHSFEVERQGGFQLNSIFQAFVQGRGSNFSWVVLSEDDVRSDDYLMRAKWAAREVGVGLVTYGRPGAYSTWKQLGPAKERKFTKLERDSFREHALGDLVVP